MTPFILAAAAALATANAASFDNAACKSFLTGTWDMAATTEMGGQAGRIATRAHYAADGTFTAVVQIAPQGMAVNEKTLSGSWSAGPGPSTDSCEASVAIDGQAPTATTLIVLDANTVRGLDGNIATRVTVTAAAP